jgi:NAD(P)-dependent dehydrogenase (short-subunit alcohol dehydrogenase family)
MSQKNIIITGAGRGIGLELVKILSKNHKVIVLSRNITALQNLPNVKTISVDFSRPEFTNNLDINHFNTIDIVIHNAGKLINKPFETLTNQDFQEVYQVNVFAVAELTRFLLPKMQKGSHVVNISSMGGVQGSSKFAGLSVYSSSKGALITLTEVLAEEYKEQKISFNALALGAVQTEMLTEAFPDYQAPTTAAEMATFIADFALNGATFFNGKVLQVANSTP